MRRLILGIVMVLAFSSSGFAVEPPDMPAAPASIDLQIEQLEIEIELTRLELVMLKLKRTQEAVELLKKQGGEEAKLNALQKESTRLVKDLEVSLPRVKKRIALLEEGPGELL